MTACLARIVRGQELARLRRPVPRHPQLTALNLARARAAEGLCGQWVSQHRETAPTKSHQLKGKVALLVVSQEEMDQLVRRTRQGVTRPPQLLAPTSRPW